MKVLLQRVSSASVSVESKTVAAIDRGVLALCGFGTDDSSAKLKPMAEKIANLRIFPCERGRFDRSLRDISGSLLVVPQFTLYADTSKGRRPDFFASLGPTEASQLFSEFADLCQTLGLAKVERGIFGADMQVSLVNDGPVTILLEE